MDAHLIINPITDKTFETDVLRAAEAHYERTDQLEAALRPMYPNIKVNNGVIEQDGRRRWYVYRDGHWTAAASEP